MHLQIHVPMFGTANIDSRPIECPTCPRGVEHGVNDWQESPIETCNPGDEYTCARCGTKVYINWGLAEPDHLSNWKNSEHCPHRLCRIKYRQLKEGMARPKRKATREPKTKRYVIIAQEGDMSVDWHVCDLTTDQYKMLEKAIWCTVHKNPNTSFFHFEANQKIKTSATALFKWVDKKGES